MLPTEKNLRQKEKEWRRLPRKTKRAFTAKTKITTTLTVHFSLQALIFELQRMLWLLQCYFSHFMNAAIITQVAFSD